MKLLGIDYGDKHLGLAIADSETKLASPWQVIDNELGALKKIIAEEQIGKVVVGRPQGMSGQTSGQLNTVDKFIELLKNNFNIPVETEDERLSTVSANKLMGGQSAGLPAGRHGWRKRGERDDAVSAMLILQNYLDRK
ncbi:MAG: Holliday junction resolvase RuvX [Patescibacteria group bacterium]